MNTELLAMPSPRTGLLPEPPATMRAVTQRAYGSADVLRHEHVPTPTPGPGEVLVRVHAAAVCKGDVHLMTGKPYLVRAMFGLRRPRNPVLGQEVSGTVAAVGAGVTQLSVGDEVFGPVGAGGFAEYVCAAADKLAPKPGDLDFVHAAAVGDSAMTALQGLRDAGRLQPGQRVLVHGASGGVGTFAVQIAKALGGEVTAVCSTRHVEMVSRLGADRVVDYTKEDFVATTAEPFDVILDLVGDCALRDCRRVLKDRGHFVAAAGAPGRNWIGPLWWMGKVQLANLFRKSTWKTFLVQFRNQDLRVLEEMVRTGKVEPVVEQVLPFARTADAMRHVAKGHAQGKTVVRVIPE